MSAATMNPATRRPKELAREQRRWSTAGLVALSACVAAFALNATLGEVSPDDLGVDGVLLGDRAVPELEGALGPGDHRIEGPTGLVQIVLLRVELRMALAPCLHGCDGTRRCGR